MDDNAEHYQKVLHKNALRCNGETARPEMGIESGMLNENFIALLTLPQLLITI